MLCSPVEASRQRVNPLLNSYTDYEDSVYGKCSWTKLSLVIILVHEKHMKIL